MPYFTLDSIRDNPWNAVAQNIPPTPDSDLLRAAFEAANRCIEGRSPVTSKRSWRNHSLKPLARLSDLCKLHARLFGGSIRKEAER